ncbi:MAG: SAM-dependent methyltransferase [Paenibacillus sp.]|nr:SAM-dependent methyltransferase [Paenibacillus sp.]
MKQNKYDDPGFFAKYSEMPRSVGGLDSAGEWPVFRALMPELRGKRVLDIGCGFGWHCRYAREQLARSVMGIDLSENMIARAKESTDDPAIEYRILAIEDMNFDAAEFDVAISSLALHYVERRVPKSASLSSTGRRVRAIGRTSGVHRARRARLALRSAWRTIALARRSVSGRRAARSQISGQRCREVSSYTGHLCKCADRFRLQNCEHFRTAAYPGNAG